MIKKEQILIALFFVFLSATVCLMLTSMPIQKINNPNLALSNISIAQMENGYKAQAKNIFNDYTRLIINNNYTLDQITQIKNRLLNLKVPAKFKELHVNLVLALTRMENWLINKNESEKIACQQIVDQAKTDYDWLNN
ncbi:MAG: hypothetical protein V1649_03855 [Patescibacteria group bacterium]